MNTTEFLNIASLIVPDRLAVVFEGARYTYAELKSRVNRLANALAELGVGEGDRVAVLHVNSNEHVELCFATAQLDAVYAPLNFRARADELTFMVNDAQPKVLVAGNRYLDLVGSFADDPGRPAQAGVPGAARRRLALLRRPAGRRRRRGTLPAGRRGGPDRAAVHVRHHQLPQGRHAQPRQLLVLHTQPTSRPWTRTTKSATSSPCRSTT